MQLQMLCYKLLKKIFITGLLIVATVPHDYRKRYSWLLGNSVLFLISAARITGEQAVSRMRTILGTPQAFANNIKASTQDFIADHFGARAIACAFGIAIRMRG